MDIRFVKREDIEEARWNGCVHYSANGLIYGYSWYLDNVAENWDALVEGNYESVFPLVWNTKILGYKQLYQPPLCQQLGLFSVNVRSATRIKGFIDAIPKEFRFANIQLNEDNVLLSKLSEEINIEKRPNYVLAVNKTYDEIRQNYSTNLKRNLKKVDTDPMYLDASLKPEAFVAAVKAYHKEKKTGVPESYYHAAHRIIWNCFHRGQGAITSIVDKKTQKLCAAIFWMFNNGRAINLMNVTTPLGRERHAMHYLLDIFIQQNAGRPMVIDFEGSSIEGIARFYKSFGAEEIPYHKISYNRLPWWVKILKR